jgi:hypothetical protein
MATLTKPSPTDSDEDSDKGPYEGGPSWYTHINNGSELPEENGRADSPNQLSDKEANPSAGGGDDASGDSPASAESDRLGKGYTGGPSRTGGASNFISRIPGSAKTKKWIIGICAGIAAALIGSVFAFLALLPLKIISIVTNLEHTFSATTENALDKETGNLFNGYERQIIRAYNAPSCHGSTIDATCVANITGNNPVSKLYQAWKQQRLEQQLATKYNIVIGKNTVTNKLYMTIDGVNAASDDDLKAVMNGDKSIFDLGGGVKQMSVTEVRQRIDSALEGASLWDKAYFRFKYSKLLETKYGVKLCVIACNVYDKFTAPISQKLKTAEAQIVMRVIQPVNQSYALAVACAFNDSCDPTHTSDTVTDADLTAGDPDPEALTTFQQQLQSSLLSLLDSDPEELASIITLSNSIIKNGFAASIASEVAQQIATQLLGQSAESAAAAGEAAVPIVGWVLLGAKVEADLARIGPALRVLGYASSAAAAVSMWSTYSSVASEMKSGHTDSTEVGTFTQSLDSNINPNSRDDSDATSTPFYNELYGDGSSNANSSYRCNDGNKVPAGQVVCPEEQLDSGNRVANSISYWTNIPVITGAADFVNTVFNNGILQPVFSVLVDTFGLACHAIPGCESAMSALQQGFGQIISWLAGKLIASPFTGPDAQPNNPDISGGRTFDMMAAGADVSYNTSCRVQLGCQALSPQQVATIRNQQLDNEKAQFDSQPFFARMFSTSSPYSLVSRLAVAIPSTNPLTAFGQWFSDFISNPFSQIATVFSSVFASDKAFAATPAAPDPFGVVQYGYLASDPVFTNSTFANDPETYWQQNCQNNATTLSWINNQNDVDPDTGESEPTTTEPCLLIQSSVQSAGVLFDTSLAPPNSLNPDPVPQGQGQ